MLQPPCLPIFHGDVGRFSVVVFTFSPTSIGYLVSHPTNPHAAFYSAWCFQWINPTYPQNSGGEQYQQRIYMYWIYIYIYIVYTYLYIVYTYLYIFNTYLYIYIYWIPTTNGFHDATVASRQLPGARGQLPGLELAGQRLRGHRTTDMSRWLLIDISR